MAFSKVQSKNVTKGAGSSFTASFTSTPTPGNLIIVALSSSGPNSPATSVTDNQTGNTYTQIGSAKATPSSGDQIQVFYAVNVNATGMFTITITFPGSSVGATVAIFEYTNTGISTVVLDKNNSGNGTSTTPASTSITPSAANELIFSAEVDAASDGTSITAGTNYTIQETQLNSSANERLGTEHWIQTTATATTGAFTLGSSAQWAAKVASFRIPTAFTKTLTDTVSLTETLVKATGRTIVDSVSLVESMIKSPGKTLSATVTLTESLTHNSIFARILTDSISLAETLVKAVAKTRTDVITPHDGIGYALLFDGSQNYVSLGTMGNLGSNLGSGFYCKFDIKTTEGDTNFRGFGTRNSGSTTQLHIFFNRNSGFGSASGKILFQFNDEANNSIVGATTNTTNFNDGNLHTIEIIGNPNPASVTIKVDGVSYAISYGSQTNLTTFGNLTHAFTIGATGDDGSIGNFMDCYIDYFIIGTSSGSLYGNYQLTDGSGTTITDSSGNGNTGTLTGSPVPTWVLGLTSGPQKAIGKFPSDSISLIETMNKNIAILKTATISLTESLQRSINRSITESVSLLESLGRSLSRSISDSLSLTESLAKASVKRLSDQINPLETLVYNSAFSRSLTDAISLSEVILKSLSRQISEGISLTEIFSHRASFLRSITDTVLLSESITRFTNKSITEVTSLIEVVNHSVSKKISDTISLVEILIHSSQFYRILSDAINLQESLAKAVGKVFSEGISLTESFVFLLRSIGLNVSSTVLGVARNATILMQRKTGTVLQVKESPIDIPEKEEATILGQK